MSRDNQERRGGVNEDRAKLAAVLRHLRATRVGSLRAMSRASGVSASELSRIELGRRVLGDRILALYAAAASVTVDELLRRAATSTPRDLRVPAPPTVTEEVQRLIRAGWTDSAEIARTAGCSVGHVWNVRSRMRKAEREKAA